MKFIPDCLGRAKAAFAVRSGDAIVSAQFDIQSMIRTSKAESSWSKIARTFIKVFRWGKRFFEEPESSEFW